MEDESLRLTLVAFIAASIFGVQQTIDPSSIDGFNIEAALFTGSDVVLNTALVFFVGYVLALSIKKSGNLSQLSKTNYHHLFFDMGVVMTILSAGIVMSITMGTAVANLTEPYNTYSTKIGSAILIGGLISFSLVVSKMMEHYIGKLSSKIPNIINIGNKNEN